MARERTTTDLLEGLGGGLIALGEGDHYGAHTDQDDVVIEAVLRTLRRHG